MANVIFVPNITPPDESSEMNDCKSSLVVNCTRSSSELDDNAGRLEDLERRRELRRLVGFREILRTLFSRHLFRANPEMSGALSAEAQQKQPLHASASSTCRTQRSKHHRANGNRGASNSLNNSRGNESNSSQQINQEQRVENDERECHVEQKCKIVSQADNQTEESNNKKSDGRRRNSKTCCFCWCCCCSCSCLNVKPNSKEELSHPLTNSQARQDASTCDERISHEEVVRWSESFDKLINSSSGRKEFREFLVSEYSEENILFWLQCEELKLESSPEAVEERARHIYEDYISILSPKEVSLDSRVREIINRNMVEPNKSTFDEAQLQIYTLMQRDSYPRFLNSAMYKRILHQTAQT